MSSSEKKPFELVRFLWKHKNEILGAAVCVAVSAYAWYELSKTTPLTNDEENYEEDLRIPVAATISPSQQHQEVTSISVENTRSQELSRIHTLFDKTIRILIPTIRAKVSDTIDVNSAIRKIKELRCEYKTEITVNDDDQDEEDEQDRTDMRITEAMLWEEVKVSSLTLLFVSTYLVSAVTVVLRMHLHMMGNTNAMLGHRRDVSMVDNGVNPIISDVDTDHIFEDTSNDLLNQHQLEQMVQMFLNGPFQHFFDQGIETLTRDVQQQVVLTFAEWNVQDKVAVHYNEFVRLTSQLRSVIEHGTNPLQSSSATSLPPFPISPVEPSSTSSSSTAAVAAVAVEAGAAGQSTAPPRPVRSSSGITTELSRKDNSSQTKTTWIKTLLTDSGIAPFLQTSTRESRESRTYRESNSTNNIITNNNNNNNNSINSTTDANAIDVPDDMGNAAVGSPLFHAALTQACDLCFEKVFASIKHNAFSLDQDYGYGPVSPLRVIRKPLGQDIGSPGHHNGIVYGLNTGTPSTNDRKEIPVISSPPSSSHSSSSPVSFTSQLRSPPLASLLPQLKGTALRLLPLHMGPGRNGSATVGSAAGGGGGGSGSGGRGVSSSVLEVYLNDVCGQNAWLERLCLAVFDRREDDLMRVDEWEREEGRRRLVQNEEDRVSPSRSKENHQDNRNNINSSNNHNENLSNPSPAPLPHVLNTYQSLVSEWEINNEWDSDPSKEISNVEYLAKIIAHGGERDYGYGPVSPLRRLKPTIRTISPERNITTASPFATTSTSSIIDRMGNRRVTPFPNTTSMIESNFVTTARGEEGHYTDPPSLSMSARPLYPSSSSPPITPPHLADPVKWPNQNGRGDSNLAKRHPDPLLMSQKSISSMEVMDGTDYYHHIARKVEVDNINVVDGGGDATAAAAATTAATVTTTAATTTTAAATLNEEEDNIASVTSDDDDDDTYNINWALKFL